VTGQADRVPLLPDQPNAAANRRVAITLLRSLPESARAP
jgi:chemotaxis protein MotB